MQETITTTLLDLIPQAMGHAKVLFFAIVLLIIGFWLIKRVTRGLRALMTKRNCDPTLMSFTVSVVNIALKVLLLISAISYVGIPMTSFVAILGAASLAVGMALQGTLQNFAGGVMLLLFRPFKVGDYVELSGFSGTVKEIQIFNTVLTTGDNKVVMIPNGGISTASMTNYSRMPERRVDLSFGIGYSDSIDQAYDAIRAVIARNADILQTPAPFMAVGSLGDSSVNITVRLWVKSENYWSVFFYMNEFVKKEFDKQGISIPFPQRDVHIVKE